MTKRLDPYVRIMRAAERGKGVVLTADEVWDMSFDSAIATRAENISEGIIYESFKQQPGKPETSE